MKLNTIMKLITALAAAAGAIYIAATYGEKIVAWAKKIMDFCCPEHFADVPVAPEAAAEDFVPSEPSTQEEVSPAQESDFVDPAVEEPVAEEPAAEPVPSDDAIPVADEDDFEG